MTEQSVTDLNIVAENSHIFSLLYRNLPADLVLDFFERASAWEIKHSLTSRLGDTTELVQRAIAQVPQLRSDSRSVARGFAEFMMGCNATLFSFAAQLAGGGKGPLTLDWTGTDHLTDRPVIVVVPHLAYFHAAPIVLAARGKKPAVLSNPVSYGLLRPALEAISPSFLERMEYIQVPGPGSARAALSALQRGQPLVVFPEVDMGITANVRAESMPFLGRRVRVPTSIARFARLAQADIVPLSVLPGGPRQVVIAFDTPVAPPESRSADTAVSLRLFEWLERAVLRCPQWWWCWPMIDSDMSVDGPGTVRNLARQAAEQT